MFSMGKFPQMKNFPPYVPPEDQPCVCVVGPNVLTGDEDLATIYDAHKRMVYFGALRLHEHKDPQKAFLTRASAGIEYRHKNGEMVLEVKAYYQDDHLHGACQFSHKSTAVTWRAEYRHGSVLLLSDKENAQPSQPLDSPKPKYGNRLTLPPTRTP